MSFPLCNPLFSIICHYSSSHTLVRVIARIQNYFKYLVKNVRKQKEKKEEGLFFSKKPGLIITKFCISSEVTETTLLRSSFTCKNIVGANKNTTLSCMTFL